MRDQKVRDIKIRDRIRDSKMRDQKVRDSKIRDRIRALKMRDFILPITSPHR